MNPTPRTVLVVDDVAEDRFFYTRFLEEMPKDHPLHIESFPDAETALARCDRGDVDCLLVDYELPDLSGIELLDKLGPERLENMAVVMVTGRGSERVAVEALKRGAAEYIVKSELNAESLCRAVAGALERLELRQKLRVAEKERWESEERLRLFIEGVQDYAIVMVNPAGAIVTWNSGAKRLFAYDEKEALGRSWASLVVDTSRDGGKHHEELDLRRKDGTTFCASVVTTELAREKGASLGFAKVIRDLTEQRSAERELRNAVAARDEFLSIASHELKTPVSAILLEVQALRLAEAKALPVDRKLALLWAGLARCDQQIARLAKLTEQLLDVSRVSAGRFTFQYSDFDLDRLVSETLDEFGESLARAQVTVVRELTTGLHVHSDAMRLGQVVRNLVGNVIKYAPKGALHVHVGKTEEGLAFARFRDTGPGIEKAHQARVFQRFERASNSRHVSGLGLGLYIARRLLEGLGGTIDLDSEPGQGSTFTLTLPATPVAK